VGRKLAYPHHYQTRSRGLDEAPTELVVTNEEEDSNTPCQRKLGSIDTAVRQPQGGTKD
jgi:hypothetical protein